MTSAPLAGPHAQVGAALVHALSTGDSVVLATLVDSTGHAYRAPGAQLLVAATTVVGQLSAGCVEGEVAARARTMLDEGTTDGQMVFIDTDDDGSGVGAGCGARLGVVLEPVAPRGRDVDAWLAWGRALRDGAPARRWMVRDAEGRAHTVAWATEQGVHRTRATFDGHGATLAAALGPTLDAARDAPLDVQAWDVHARIRDTRHGWLESVPRPPRVTIAGHGADAEAVARTMARMGWRVRLIGRHRLALAAIVERAGSTGEATPATAMVDAPAVERWLRRQRDERHHPSDVEPGLEEQDVVLAAGHDLELDPAVVAWAVLRGAVDVGVIGSRRRVRRVLDGARALLVAAGADDAVVAKLDEVDGPAGLDVGARGPWEMATAVAARWIADLRRRSRPVWAVVPAAGAARRLGFVKPLVHKGGTTLIERTVALVEATCDGTVVVVRGEASEVVDRIGAGPRVVHVGGDVRGLRGSLAAGVAAVPDGARVMVVLPDMPGVDAAHLAGVRAGAITGARDGGAVTAYSTAPSTGTMHPGTSTTTVPHGPPALLPCDVVATLRDADSTRPHRPDAADESDESDDDVGVRGRWMQRPSVRAVALADASDLDDVDAVVQAGWSTEGVAPTR